MSDGVGEEASLYLRRSRGWAGDLSELDVPGLRVKAFSLLRPRDLRRCTKGSLEESMLIGAGERALPDWN